MSAGAGKKEECWASPEKDFIPVDGHVLRDSIIHLFLPKKVPECLQRNMSDVDRFLLESFAFNIKKAVNQELSSDEEPFPQLDPVMVMFEKWKRTQIELETLESLEDISEWISKLQNELISLELGATLPIYIDQQNCTLLITRSNDNDITVSTYRSALPAKTVMSTVGSHSIMFPETIEKIQNKNLLTSRAFAKLVYELRHGYFEDISSGRAIRGGSSYVETRDVADPRLVQDWIIGLLVPTKNESNQDEYRISKKIRDQINLSKAVGSSQNLPFRRSGMYMSLKVAMQLKLGETFKGNEAIAKYIYKILMLRLLTETATELVNLNQFSNKIDMDISSQILAKLGKRTRKLENFPVSLDQSDQSSTMIIIMREKCLTFTESIVLKLSTQMQNVWQNAALKTNFMSVKSFPKLRQGAQDFGDSDLHHNMDTLDNHIRKIRDFLAAKNQPRQRPNLVYERFERCSTAESLVNSKIRETNTKLWLQDVETYVKYHCTESSMGASALTGLINNYVSHAKSSYANNPLGMSQILLVTLKGLYVLDKIATAMYPLLLEYKLEINIDVFDHLLLPFSKDMALLGNLLEYFSDRDKNAEHSGILNSSVDSETFSVRFALNNESMKTLRQKILVDTEDSIQSKLIEVDSVRRRCEELQKQMQKEESCTCRHETNTWTNRWGKRRWKRVRVFHCLYCRLKEQLSSLQNSVSYYERPLPPQDDLQFAVVFELLLPQTFSVWRDYVAYFKYFVLGQDAGASERFIKCKWLTYRKLSVYTSLTETNTNFALGSSSLPSSSTYLTNSNLNVLHHTNQNFIVNNGMTCSYNYRSQGKLTNYWKSSCAYKIASTLHSEPYTNLQDTLESTEHFQNAIIARQYKCHEDLSLREYICYGSLRAGHRIQMRNLYEAISSETLSLQMEPVLALILQTLWQVGPRDKLNRVESHLDFEDCEFAQEFMEMLDKLVEQNEANYGKVIIVLISVVVARRIAELNGSLEAISYKYLRKWRTILGSWIKKINNELNQPEAASDMLRTSSLKMNLVKIVITSLFSFNVADPTYITSVIKDQDDLGHWFEALYQFNRIDKRYVSTSGFLDILLDVGKWMPLQVGVDIGAFDETFRANAIHAFICQHWGNASQCRLVNLMQYPYSSVVLANYLDPNSYNYQVSFDLFQGTFLVNGFSQTEMPFQVRQNKQFQRFFENAFHLQGQQQSTGCTTTLSKYLGKHYEFNENFDDEVLIREINDDGTSLFLLNPSIFTDQISNFFLGNHTHWLDLKKSIIYFRPFRKDVKSSKKSNDDEAYDYRLEKVQVNARKSTWKLYYPRKKVYILSPHSNCFSRFASILQNFEVPQYINVTRSHDSLSTAFLRRHNLRFTLKDNGEYKYESVEYSGYSISAKQTCQGTLVGLCQGLLLENGEKRLLLVPHTTIQVSPGPIHHTVTLPLDILRQPSCFDYEFDDVLKRLKARNNKCAHLYLAALHAVTSSSLPDPFTEITGTEMAVRILQSACVWSCSPYDPESLKTLTFIHGLSPVRKYYGKGIRSVAGSMEDVKWPNGLPSMVAYDGFAIIVEKLLSNSDRLALLHDQTEAESHKDLIQSSDIVRVRAYHRTLPMYNSVVAVQKPEYFNVSQLSLLDGRVGQTASIPLRNMSTNFNLDLLTLVSYHQLARSICPMIKSDHLCKNTLATFLLTKGPICSPIPAISLYEHGAFYDIFQSFEFRSNWLKLYTLAVNCSQSEDDRTCFAAILSTLAYRGAPIQQIANLHCIATLSALGTDLDFPDAPIFPASANTYHVHANPTSNDFEVKTVEQILNSHAKPFNALQLPDKPKSTFFFTTSSEIVEYEKNMEAYKKQLDEYLEQKKAYEDRVKLYCSSMSPKIKEYFWPCANIEYNSIKECLDEEIISVSSALEEINSMLKEWHRNYILTLFIMDVQNKLNGVIENINKEDKLEDPVFLLSEGGLAKRISYAKVEEEAALGFAVDGQLFKEPLVPKWKEVVETFKSGNFDYEDVNMPTSWSINRERCQQKIEEIKTEMLRMMATNVHAKICFSARLLPRCDPGSILEYLKVAANSETSHWIVDYAGALAVLWCHLQRMNRCIRSQNEVDIQRETSNPGHTNWSPKQFPEWLLLELELNIMIRPIQVDVALQMMKMPNAANGVTQLNMGEGKSSVIVPMLCSALAKKEQLCRVTVLSSMFKMNLNSLTYSLGGFLDQRIYYFPCRRDMEIEEDVVHGIQDAYKECLELRGVVLTLPEYRLSFRLLAYDRMFKGGSNLGQKMLGIENWLRGHARDVLDESDELFNVKYQLVYTIGTQVPLDGGEIRWTTCQRMLEFVLNVAPKLTRLFGTSLVEFDEMAQIESPHQFSTFRLLGTGAMVTFVNLLADKILQEMRLVQKEREIVKRFLTESQVDEQDHTEVMQNIFKDNDDELQIILLLSGYLRRGVFGLGLQKRWRVEYGVNPKQGFRRMAVPFRAKDVAAEKTEFGHPDLAIILTHLSYYYSGLDDKQLNEVLRILKRQQAPEDIYDKWISRIPPDRIPASLLKYRSLNFKDLNQKSILFELFRKHKMVVDFWLSHCVFPRESKQFPGKLVMTAWDLCYERQKYPVTGFSGTNDSKILLPIMITQQDLPQLEDTNHNVEITLLRPENGNHRGFGMGVTCKEILETMKTDNLTVLIDSGALMLECSNVQVAELWLEVNREIEAVVYFTKDNELLVKCRGERGPGTPFDVSPYQGRLDKCGVFLDDQHTRGTDFKFPIGSRACVTVATRMKRDKLIQACMRMRKLGQGHSVTFYLSHEAHDKVCKNSAENNEITTKLVLEWVCQNTEESNQDGLLYWALAGRNYAQRLAAEDNFHWPSAKTPFLVKTCASGLERKAKVLANQCVDDEVTKLMDMYGQHTTSQLLWKLIPVWFSITKAKLQRKSLREKMNADIFKDFDIICNAIVQKCKELVPDRTHVSSTSGTMEEEQEKELEMEKEVEVEEEQQVERPRSADPAQHTLHPNVESIVLYGTPVQPGMEGISGLPGVFRSTTFWSDVQPHCWDAGVFVTNDFARTIKGSQLYFKTDSFLRPIQYLVSIKNENNYESCLLVLSPYEVNLLMPFFRSGQTKCRLHMFSSRKTATQDLLLNKSSLQLPSKNGPCAVTNVLSDSSRSLASLLLASGSLYFVSMEEQKAFVRFLGLVPQPWSLEEATAFEKGWISKTGFSLPKFRSYWRIGASSQEQMREGFDKDPTGLVTKILKCRHPMVSQVTHVMHLLDEKKYIEFP